MWFKETYQCSSMKWTTQSLIMGRVITTIRTIISNLSRHKRICIVHKEEMMDRWCEELRLRALSVTLINFQDKQALARTWEEINQPAEIMEGFHHLDLLMEDQSHQLILLLEIIRVLWEKDKRNSSPIRIYLHHTVLKIKAKQLAQDPRLKVHLTSALNISSQKTTTFRPLQPQEFQRPQTSSERPKTWSTTSSPKMAINHLETPAQNPMKTTITNHTNNTKTRRT